jgi:ABC-type antimicrobial peptide transport system permease subunit
VLVFAVGQRTREFGVRLALGARPAAVFRLVLRDGSVLLLAGTAVGAVVAMWTAHLLGAWLYGLPATDVWSLVLAEGVLAVTSLAACSVPAWRATRADPVDVLREA